MPPIPQIVQLLIFSFVVVMSVVMIYLSFGLIILKLVLDRLIQDELQREIEISEDSFLKMMVVWPVALIWIGYKWLRHKPPKNGP